MAKTSPTQRTKARLKKEGILCDIAEKWIQYAPGDPRREFSPGFRKDLFGIIDVVALVPARGVLGIQCTGQSGFSSHWKKLTVEKAANTVKWLTTPGTSLEIWSWRKLQVKRGGKAKRWEPRIVEITLEDMAPYLECISDPQSTSTT